MCGFAGFYQQSNRSRDEITNILEQMGHAIAYRGPDSSGIWMDDSRSVGLTHRRLSIQDLSPLGHQPMLSGSGRYVIVYNGEVYNFLEIKQELEATGNLFRGGSDTEVILCAIENWGLEKTLSRLTGMFAFALVDTRENELILVRDRTGEKPLYYGWQNNTFFFGSELKALRQHPDFQTEINRDAITLLLRHNFIPAPHSIYRNISKLEPGNYLKLKLQTNSFSIHNYWSHRHVVCAGVANQLTDSPEEIVESLESRLKKIITRQIIADVPVGAFLSGGIDSSTIVALMQSISNIPVKTFTIGFEDKNFNEANYARSISEILGTEHTELYLSQKDALDVIPRLSHIYDEPFADSSQIPTYLISRLAREKVTVALTGDAGDEMFCGYPRYFKVSDQWRNLQKYPYALRSTMSAVAKMIPETVCDRLLSPLARNKADFSNRLREKAELWRLSGYQQTYQFLVSYWKNSDVVIGGSEPDYVLNDKRYDVEGLDLIQKLQYLDKCWYLPDDILVKVDRAAMSNSLETRIPLLDHTLLEYTARIPTEINLLHKSGKWPLRQILSKYIPQDLIERPKMGFAVPVKDWLRADLSEWAGDLLNRDKLVQEGFFRADEILEKWDLHRAAKVDYSFHLWGVLMFQEWYSHWH